MKYNCPFCGAAVLNNDDTKSILHAAPLCERWATMMQHYSVGFDSHLTLADPNHYNPEKMRASLCATCTPVDPGSLTLERVAAGWLVTFACGCSYRGVPNYVEPGTVVQHECEKAPG